MWFSIGVSDSVWGAGSNLEAGPYLIPWSKVLQRFLKLDPHFPEQRTVVAGRGGCTRKLVTSPAVYCEVTVNVALRRNRLPDHTGHSLSSFNLPAIWLKKIRKKSFCLQHSSKKDIFLFKCSLYYVPGLIHDVPGHQKQEMIKQTISRGPPGPPSSGAAD